ncbi:hypothetical protein AZA_03041 [Nitrospirillum viridazoti Y2]|nr:hypothetical protein AZA_03041 [Nitrospirillum amazonense Y2]
MGGERRAVGAAQVEEFLQNRRAEAGGLRPDHKLGIGAAGPGAEGAEAVPDVPPGDELAIRPLAPLPVLGTVVRQGGHDGGRPQFLVRVHAPRHAEVHAALQRLDMLRQIVGQHHVVSVETGDEVALGVGHQGVEGDVGAAITRQVHDLQGRVRRRPDIVQRVVAAIHAQQHLQAPAGGQRLREHGVEAVAQPGARAKGGDQDGYGLHRAASIKVGRPAVSSRRPRRRNANHPALGGCGA